MLTRIHPVLRLLVASLILQLVSTSVTAQPRRIPLRDFFRNPERTAYELSPSGENYAFLMPYESRLNIFVQSRNGGDARRLTSETDRDIQGYWWKGNDRLLFVKDKGGDENYHLFSVSLDGKQTDLTPFDSVTVQVIDGLIDRDDEILIAMNKRNREVFDVYHVHLKSGEMSVVAENPGNISTWVTDHDGKLRVAVTTDGVNSSMLYRETEKDEFKPVMTTSFKESISPLFFTFDNKHLYVNSNIGRDKTAIVKIDPSTGKELDVLFTHPEVDVDRMAYSHKRKVLTTITYTTDREHRHYLDGEIERIYRALESRFPNEEVALTSHNRNEDLFIVRNWSDRSRGAIHLYDAKAEKLSKIADIAPWIDANEMAPMKPISYTSRDGLTIHGYLTLPLGKEAKNLPVVVHPHGGPWYRDVWRFSPEVQFFANRGYAVLQMNFRGSLGYGRQFWEASFKQWGKKMQDDITDGVQWLIDQGIADPKRIAIYGGSYGGYATLAGVAFTPDLYTCAIDYVGVSNLFTFMKTIPPYWKPYLDMLYEMVGDPVKDKEHLTATSPVFHVDKIKTPLLILQGRNDPRVNVDESDQMVEALRKRGVDVPYIVKDNEGHGFHNEENRFEAYEAMEAFLQKHLGS